MSVYTVIQDREDGNAIKVTWLSVRVLTGPGLTQMAQQFVPSNEGHRCRWRLANQSLGWLLQARRHDDAGGSLDLSGLA
jgi:hypothetical protein